MIKTQTNFNNGYFLEPEVIKTIRAFHDENKPPYLVNKLSEKFDIEGVYLTGMPENISGCIKKTETGKYEILLNRDEHHNRRRFTAAHELAHLLLHRDDIGDGVNDDVLYRSKLSTFQEVQANQLAADILMPFDKIYALLQTGTKLRELPSIFEVSNITMCIRLDISEFVLFSPNQ